MKITLFLILIYLGGSTLLVAQEEETKSRGTLHNFRFGIGPIAYKNYYSIPNGLAGGSMSFTYQMEKEHKTKKRDFLLRANFDYSYLENSKVLTTSEPLFRRFKIRLGPGLLWPLNLKNNQLHLQAGGNISFYGEYIYPTESGGKHIYHPIPYGNWSINCNALIVARYQAGRITIEESLKVAIFTAGFFPEFQYTPTSIDNSYYWDFLKINTISTIPNYRMIENKIAIYFPLANNQTAISWRISYNHYNFENSQKYIEHNLGVGIRF
ncbi:hypothetical protein [Alkalitalea saponilacus]|uniref:Outer membrane protein beta-barrel domain-containing protein n=1 Tax=Alkalitalea saponilacus TaxID=889453 RepID=A0A1T5AXN2_9BACT|nr:hypothetical protein [Alkalitalea saponilacus]ASB48559.1 hypothetical protein CDL62_05105 [Alkalitalea saponilacus]SKB39734.1 hypothetical protein SAMN03080601_00419 [Alkalitalea saponilacus]